MSYGDEDSYTSPWSTPSVSESVGGLPRQWEECSWSSESEREPWSCCEWSDTSSDLEPSDTTINPPRQAVTKVDIPKFLESPLRRSPRVPKAKPKFDPSSIVKDELGWQLSKVVELNGCNPQCAKNVHDLHEHDILIAHAMFSSKPQGEQRSWILEYFATHCPYAPDGKKDIKNLRYILCGRVVCRSLWLAALAISTSRFYDIRKEFITVGSSCQEKKGRSGLSPKSMKCVEWMRSYFERVGDKRPDKDGIYLPTCLTEKAIYKIMKGELPHDSVICSSQFNKLYRSQFPNVTIPKECRFTKCNFCTLVKNELYKPTTAKEEKEKLRQLLDEHVKLQEQERQRYYANRQRSIENPSESLSLIVDGMDQNKTNLPHLIRVPKSCQNLWSLRTHLTGTLVHGIGNYGYFDFLQFPHDSNLTLTVLLHTLLSISKKGNLPRKLLIQMDNCVRENKNKYVMAFMTFLVEMQVFVEIEMGFLMVGHTHEDIDQTFSCLSRHLQKCDALTMRDMEQRFLASSQLSVAVSTLQYVYDIRKWLTPAIDDIQYHTTPHIFRFRRNADGRGEMHYKHWSSDDWRPNDNGLLILKHLPIGVPELVQPVLEKVDLPHLCRDIKKYNDAGVLNAESHEWWDEFLKAFKDVYGTVKADLPPWPLDALRSAAKPSSATKEVSVPTVILNLHQSEREVPREIIIGKKRRKEKVPPKPSKKTKESVETAPTEEANVETVPAGERDQPVNLEVGKFAALRLHKYDDEIPQLAKILSIGDMEVNIEWWIGNWSNNWSPWKTRGVVNTESVHRNAIIMAPISLTKSNRLTKETIIHLKKLYDGIEFM